MDGRMLDCESALVPSNAGAKLRALPNRMRRRRRRNSLADARQLQRSLCRSPGGLNSLGCELGAIKTFIQLFGIFREVAQYSPCVTRLLSHSEAAFYFDF